MRYHWNDIPGLLHTPMGRKQFLEGVYRRSWPILSCLASIHRRTLARSTRVVAVVGSYGKSTTMRATAAALKAPFSRLSLRNSWSFVAGALLRIRPHHRHAVIEVGIDGVGQMVTYARMIRPDIVVVTSIGSEHNRSLGSLEVTRQEKSEMVRILSPSGTAILNGDDPNVVWMKPNTRARVVTFGLAETNDIHGSDIILDWPNGTKFKLHAYGESRDMTIKLIGRHMVCTILSAIAVALTEGFPLNQIIPSLENLSPTPGRLEPIKLPYGAFILRDDFKSSLETFDSAFDAFSEIPARRRVVVLGEISEPPGSQGPIYRKIGEQIAKIASQAIFVGGSFQRYAAGARRGGLSSHLLMDAGRSVLKVVETLRGDLGPGDVVLIKGRDTQRLDRITLALTGRTVRCDISSCNARAVRCEQCPMLEKGWKGLRIVI